MEPEIVSHLAARRADIKQRWRTLLEIEPVSSAMARPEMLALLLDETLNRIFTALRSPRRRPRTERLDCECGRNPFTAYFVAGRQALYEVLIEVQAETPELSPAQRQATLADLKRAFETVAHDEIESFAAVCQHRPSPAANGRNDRLASSAQRQNRDKVFVDQADSPPANNRPRRHTERH
jgi:hypothetical protein